MANHHPSPRMGMPMQHGPPGPPGLPQGPPGPAHYPEQRISVGTIAAVNERTWVQIGRCMETLDMPDDALTAYENALRFNVNCVPALLGLGKGLRRRELYQNALDLCKRALGAEPNNGEAWALVGHCHLMMDNLTDAFSAYQNAVANLSNPKDPELWYGIGILYDRHGSLEHAEEAFSQVMQNQPDYEKATEIYFRLGIIYKQQGKFQSSLECFKYIAHAPPPPLTEEDVWFQLGHVYEQLKDYDNAKQSYQRVLDRQPAHAKVLQQLGWLYHQQSNSFTNQERAIEYLEKSVNADTNDAHSWYLLGRCYMAQQKYPKAYEAYQQAVYRDGRNPTFWCSIGVLYFQINQFRDALDAYSRAIRLNPYISEVWYDLGTLYESCNNQIQDALDAYGRAADLDPHNQRIKARLHILRNSSQNGQQPNGPAPMPTDIHPQAYAPPGAVGPPSQWGGPVAPQHQQPQPPPQGPPPPGNWGRLPDVNVPPSQQGYDHRGEPFRGGPPPMPRQPSPRQEGAQMRPYPGDPNHQPPMRHAGQTPPPPPPPPQQMMPPNTMRRMERMEPEGWKDAPGRPPPTGGPVNMHHIPPHHPGSPKQDMRPYDNRMPSPKSAYPQHQPHPGYGHHPPPPKQEPHGLPHGHPHMGPDGPHQRIDDRPASVGPKRQREWEEDHMEGMMKKPASDENRARMENARHRRPSTSPRSESFRRNSDERFEEQRRVEDQRRAEEMRRVEDHRMANDGYHPSEAAHHPTSHSLPPHHLPPMQSGGPSGPAPMSNMRLEGPPGPIVNGPNPKDYPVDDRARMEHQQQPPPPPQQQQQQQHAQQPHPQAPQQQAQQQAQQPPAQQQAPQPPQQQQQPPPPQPQPQSQPQSQPPVGEQERAARKVDVNDNYDDSDDDDKKPQQPGSASKPNGTASGAEIKTPTSASLSGVMSGPSGPKAEGGA